MRTNPHQYQDFLPGMTVEQYCASKIDPYQIEIEHMGLQAVLDAIIKPAGINVDVTYMDRSASEEVNTINWYGEDTGYGPMPTIRLLYRPYAYRCRQQATVLILRSGHYDILYKDGDIPVINLQPTLNPQVNLVSYSSVFGTAANPFYLQRDVDLEQIYTPGMSFSDIPSSGISSRGISARYTPDVYTSAPFTSPRPPLAQSASHIYSAPAYPPLQTSRIQTTQPPSVKSPTIETNVHEPFRHSKFQLEAAYQHRVVPQEPCQTEAMLV